MGTDMMAKFLMLAKSVDRMETLMSQKPFWRMFADPNAILAVQEISMNMLCDVVVEINRERKLPSSKDDSQEIPMSGNEVTVFDFAEVLERTERRVRVDLLGAGPKTVEELRSVANKLQVKYKQRLESKERRHFSAAGGGNKADFGQVAVDKAVATAGSAVSGATNMASGVFEKLKTTRISAPTFAIGANKKVEDISGEIKPTIVAIPPTVETNINSAAEDEWMGVTKTDDSATPSQFRNDDEDDDVDLL